jgi:ABC-type molybdate transport system substrate-binding protein
MTFRPALKQVLVAYRDGCGSAVAFYAPTPVLIRQLAGGAPADIVLTADPDWIDEAVRQGLVQPETRANLMTNDLVLAGPSGSQAVGTITPGLRSGHYWMVAGWRCVTPITILPDATRNRASCRSDFGLQSSPMS